MSALNPLNICTELANGRIRTAQGRLTYPTFFQPRLGRNEKDPKKARYRGGLLFPKVADLSLIEARVEKIVSENLTPQQRKTTKFRLPILKTADQPRFAEYADEYPYLIRCNTKMRPDVITPKGDRIITEEEEADEVYMGRWGRFTIDPFWYPASQDGSPIPGVSLGLQNVQVLNHAEPIAGAQVRGGGLTEFEAVGDDDLGDMAA